MRELPRPFYSIKARIVLYFILMFTFGTLLVGYMSYKVMRDSMFLNIKKTSFAFFNDIELILKDAFERFNEFERYGFIQRYLNSLSTKTGTPVKISIYEYESKSKTFQFRIGTGGLKKTMPAGDVSDYTKIITEKTKDSIYLKKIIRLGDKGSYLTVLCWSLDNFNKSVHKLRSTLLLMSLVLLLVTSVALYFVLYIKLFPLRKLIQVLSEYGSWNFEAKLDYKQDDEIGDIVRSINLMATSLRSVSEREEDRYKQRLIENELHLAQMVQQGLVSTEMPDYKGWSVDVIQQYKEELGGDMYDFSIVREQNKEILYVLLGDVCGKSVTAALTMVLTIGILPSILYSKKTYKNKLVKLNSEIYKRSKERFVAGTLIRIDDAHIEFALCGAPKLIYYSAKQNEIRRIGRYGVPLGMSESDGDFINGIDVTQFDVSEGDIILMYSDGVEELFKRGDKDLEMYDIDVNKHLEKRFKEIIRGSDGFEEIKESLKDWLQNYVKGESDNKLVDDTTIVVLKKNKE